jgi:hypothetical protein
MDVDKETNERISRTPLSIRQCRINLQPAPIPWIYGCVEGLYPVREMVGTPDWSRDVLRWLLRRSGWIIGVGVGKGRKTGLFGALSVHSISN